MPQHERAQGNGKGASEQTPSAAPERGAPTLLLPGSLTQRLLCLLAGSGPQRANDLGHVFSDHSPGTVRATLSRLRRVGSLTHSPGGYGLSPAGQGLVSAYLLGESTRAQAAAKRAARQAVAL